jgi:hypothetical protein
MPLLVASGIVAAVMMVRWPVISLLAWFAIVLVAALASAGIG